MRDWYAAYEWPRLISTFGTGRRYAKKEVWLLTKGESTRMTPVGDQLPILATRLDAPGIERVKERVLWGIGEGPRSWGRHCRTNCAGGHEPNPLQS